MAEFVTRIKIIKPEFQIDYNSRLFFLGSCFSDYIGKKMQQLKFTICHNPFGIVYNPISICNSILQLLYKEKFIEKDLNFHNELWFSYSHNTQFSDVDKSLCLKRINKSFEEARNFIQKSDVLLFTLGTSWVYELKETGEVVANCHKIPSAKFNRRFSPVDVTTENFCNAIQELRKSNPSVKIVFTVSPIRHWKDGAVENQRSKAALLLAIAKVQEQLEDVFYFPVYEIFMDELRDYRYYADDMLHPSVSGIEYTWERFADTFLSEESKKIISKVQSILNKINHRPLHENTNAYLKFVSSLREEIIHFQKNYPDVDFSNELLATDKTV